MNMKSKVLIVISILIIICFGGGITYSIFNSNTNIQGNQNIAKFIFNAEKTDAIQLPLIDLNPGDNKEYSFKVTNTISDKLSSVSIDYKIILETFYLIPLEIKLYKVDNENEELILECNENSGSRNNNDNQLICMSSIQSMNHSSISEDNYKLKISFPSLYNGEEYSNLVDYINIKINSWQK